MAVGQKHSGRRLFPFGSPSTSEIGQRTALALLDATSFSLRGPKSAQIMTWPEPILAARLLDCSPSELPSTHAVFHAGLPDNLQPLRQSAIDRLTFDGARYVVSYQVMRDDNELVWIEESGERIQGNENEPTYIIGVLKDISSQAKLEHINVDTSAQQECMTEDEILDILRHSQILGHSTQIIRIQVEDTTAIKEIYGPQIFDYIVKALTKRLAGQLSPSDYIAYDENRHFQLYFPNSSAQQLLAQSKKIKYILEIPVESPVGALKPGLKIGIETVPQITRSVELREQRASNQSPLIFRPRKKIDEVDILTGLEQDRFQLVFQPIQLSIRREVAYYEALLRFRNEFDELETAFPYIEAAEDFGLIDRLDRRALALARNALRENQNLKLAINVSVGTIVNDSARHAYLSDLSTLGARASDIIIELTETMAMENMEAINKFSSAIQSLGAMMAIDDFGAGHTSFENLMAIEAQILKIDGSLVQNIARDSKKQNMVRLLAEMANVFGLKTVAEMIDSEADARMVERLGVNYLQGFWLGRPDTI